MKSGRTVRWFLSTAAACLLLPWPPLLAQQDEQFRQESSSKQPDPDSPPKPNVPRPKKPQPPGPEQPVFDPLRAEKDIEVGRYYMRKGDLDAAIDRFQDATQARPGYALPFRLLAEAQEKKGRKRDAIKSYARYLEIYPRAEDADKMRKRIEKLQQELDKERRKSD